MVIPVTDRARRSGRTPPGAVELPSEGNRTGQLAVARRIIDASRVPAQIRRTRTSSSAKFLQRPRRLKRVRRRFAGALRYILQFWRCRWRQVIDAMADPTGSYACEVFKEVRRSLAGESGCAQRRACAGGGMMRASGWHILCLKRTWESFYWPVEPDSRRFAGRRGLTGLCLRRRTLYAVGLQAAHLWRLHRCPRDRIDPTQ